MRIFGGYSIVDVVMRSYYNLSGGTLRSARVFIPLGGYCIYCHMYMESCNYYIFLSTVLV